MNEMKVNRVYAGDTPQDNLYEIIIDGKTVRQRATLEECLEYLSEESEGGT